MLVLLYLHPVINLINFGADKNNIITVWRNYDSVALENLPGEA